MSLLCKIGWHQFRPAYRDGRVKACSRCAKEKRLSWTPIANPDTYGRQLTRPRTRGEKK
jgi:hypothetical protein